MAGEFYHHRRYNSGILTFSQRRRIAILPMFHAATVPLAHYATLRSGDEMYIVKKFDLETFLRVSTAFVNKTCRTTKI